MTHDLITAARDAARSGNETALVDALSKLTDEDAISQFVSDVRASVRSLAEKAMSGAFTHLNVAALADLAQELAATPHPGLAQSALHHEQVLRLFEGDRYALRFATVSELARQAVLTEAALGAYVGTLDAPVRRELPSSAATTPCVWWG
jgi:hypothetical protein